MCRMSHSRLLSTRDRITYSSEFVMRPRQPDELGIHLMFVPSASSGSIPQGAAEVLERTARDIALLCGCAFKAINVRTDHMHILLQSAQDDSIGQFIESFIEQSLTAIRASGARARSFDYDDRIHITILPPWHVELFAAFIRDQDHYHATHTVQQEIADIFMRGASNVDGDAQRQIMDSVAHVGGHAN